MKRRVAVTGIGAVSPNGIGRENYFAALAAGRSGVRTITQFDASALPARITEEVRRRYVAGLPVPEGDEVEMPEDDTVEPMPETIDLAEVTAEALALALPLYPRAAGAALGTAVFAAEGVAPVLDADLKPFAGLAALAGKLAPKADEGE